MRAAVADGEPRLAVLPAEVVALVEALACPPRLVAHLRVVHDVALRVVAWVERTHPGVAVDRAAVLFGAATHDVGKAVHRVELVAPGAVHEVAGRDLLLVRGVRPELARFAATHGSWSAPGVVLDDLLVSLADKVWKGKRVPDLEDRIVAELAAGSGREPWEEFLALDEFLTGIAAGADGRLAFQSAFPAGG